MSNVPQLIDTDVHNALPNRQALLPYLPKVRHNQWLEDGDGIGAKAWSLAGTRLPSAVYEYKYGRDQQILRCPWHGWEFDLLTGEHLVEGSVKLKAVPLEVEGEDIYLLLKNTKERAQNHV
jgi:hypothetical protein